MKITDARHPWADLIKKGWVAPTHILSIRQPWAYLIAIGRKDIENRTWTTKFRGRVLLHASKSMTRGEYGDAIINLSDIGVRIKLPAYADIERAGIVGEAEIVDCVTESKSKWFQRGSCGFVMRNARQLPFVSHKGMLGITQVKF